MLDGRDGQMVEMDGRRDGRIDGCLMGWMDEWIGYSYKVLAELTALPLLLAINVK